MNDFYPLVSIVVITYNSSHYVLETLESIKSQTYKNIELIVTDDCSSDDTIFLCQNWIEKNKSNFVRTKLITTTCNTGVSANCNRGCWEAKGEWIKCIAGDDCLCVDGIEKYIKFICLNREVLICHSKMLVFENTFLEKNLIKDDLIIPALFIECNDSYKQFLMLCLSNVIAASTVFMHKTLFEKVGGFDEQISMCEDWPMWLKITQQGHFIAFLDEYTSKYRVTKSSIMGKENGGFLFKRFYNTENIVYKKYIRKYARLDVIFFNRYDFYIRLLLDKIGLNKKNYLSKMIYYTLMFPFKIYYKALY